MDEHQSAPPDSLEDAGVEQVAVNSADSSAEPFTEADAGRHPSAEHRELTVDTDGSELAGPALSYPVVGVGASSGGFQAFRDMLEQLSPRTGMAFVFISHDVPRHDTQVVSLLQRHTKMPVRPIVEGDRPLPDHIAVLMPNQLVTLENGVFRLHQPDASEPHPASVNRFFRSLAADQKNFAVGVILSGRDGDGAEGLKTIKGEGGFALVQSPDSAVQTGMPRSSIAADHVDVILPPPALAGELERIAQQFSQPEVRSLEEGKAPDGEDQAFQRILQMLRNRSGLELRQYKPQTIRRRIARRMVLQRMETLNDYHRFMQARADEIGALQEDILINVTRFFRDPDFWEAVQAHVLPSLFQERTPGKPVRIWCAGCSTGEEAYSLAITVLEYVTKSGLDTAVQVFATDASDRSIGKARTAVYPDTIANDINPDRLRRYFLKVDDGYQVSKRVRDICIFARQNLCNDPPFSHMDIVSCRNVMIYFNQALQRQVMSTFHYALDPGGYMLLGMSEGLRDYGDAFFAVDRKHKIYTKTGGTSRVDLPMPRQYRQSLANPPGRSTNENSELWRETDLQRAADRMVVARFGPPALIVDERMNILQARGQTSPLIQLSPGTVSWNLGRVLRMDIVNEVREAVGRSIQENIAVTVTLQTFDEQKGSEQLQVDVLPIANVGPTPRCFLILFQTQAEAAAAKAGLRGSTPEASLNQDGKDRFVAQLRQDLNASRLHLQSVLEERDARNQELVSASEEIQSANEELQSTNEELETTKEELQSTNEELQTVNDELQQRNAALEQTSNDLRNLLNSVSIPLLMLTSDLHIRQFTPPMQKLISVLPTDVGRPISDIRIHLSIDNLEPLLQKVSETLVMHESEVQDKDGRWYLLRIRPYRTSDNKIEGLVVVLVDIDQLRSSQQGVIDARDFSRSVVESVPVPVVVLDDQCNVQLVNTAFRDLTGMRGTELSGRSLPDLVNLLWGLTDLAQRLQGLLSTTEDSSFIFEHKSKTADDRFLLVKGQRVAADGHQVFLLVIEDITLRRKAERMLNAKNESLEGEVKSAVAELDRTQQELRGLTAHLFSAQEEERQRVARELHDDVGQRLSLLEMILASVTLTESDTEASKKVEEAREQVLSLSTDVRTLSHQLHPAVLNDLGLSAALRALVAEFGTREGMPATYVGRNLPDLPPQPGATAVYRITQEALRNVAKHAGITHVKVILEARDGTLHLEVRDLGVGFDTEGEAAAPVRGLGMITMRERARLAHGTLSVHSALGEGTTVIADIPYHDHA